MAAYFFDSSAIIKRYAHEIGTAWVINHFKPKSGHRIYVARIAFVEVISGLTRRMRGNSLNPSQTAKAIARFRRNFQHQFIKADITSILIEQAGFLAERHSLRGYDAVQLAAALNTNNVRIAAKATSLILVSADTALNTAALAEGLQVDNPNNH